MRIKQEIFNLIKDDKTIFLINQEGTSNKWYIACPSKGSNSHQVSTAYGSFLSGPGTFRSSNKNLYDITHEKEYKKGYLEVNRAEFIQKCIEYGMFSRNEINKKKFEKTKEDLLREKKKAKEIARKTAFKPTSASSRKNFLDRLNKIN